MANDHLAYLVLVLCAILGAGMVYFTHGDMLKGIRRIRRWSRF
jgi:nitrate reductase gamma subunit